MAEKNKNSNSNSKGVIDYLLTKVPKVSKNFTVGQTLNFIRSKNNWDTINYIYVLDDTKALVGVVAIKELLRVKDSSLIKNVMKHNPVGVAASSAQERAAVMAIEHNIKAVPIFKSGTREFLGTVGTDKILDILHDEHVEDFLRFSGVGKKHPTVDIFKVSPFKLARLRLPWLLIGLVGGMLAVLIVSQFEGILRKEIALSFFIPVVVYISNAIAIQAQAILIRSLASQKLQRIKFLKKELVVSSMLAIVSATFISIFAGIWLQSFNIALVVGLAIVASTLVAVFIATVIPMILYAAKKDPALGSGPFATSIQDITTLLIYFLIATLILF